MLHWNYKNEENGVSTNFATHKKVISISVNYLCLKVVSCNDINLFVFLNVILIEISINSNLHRFSI